MLAAASSGSRGGGASGGSGGGSPGGASTGGPAPDDDHDGYPNAVDCAPEDPTVHPGAPDPPDLEFKDSNCDGIDGEASHAVFVAPGGNDASPGTQSEPKRTLAAAEASAAAQGKDVYAELGEYHETLVVSNGVSVYGGYDASWHRASSNRTKILGSLNGFGDTEAAVATNVTLPTKLQLLTLSTGAPNSGRSSYGLRGIKSPGLRLEGVTIEAAGVAAGAGGSNGATGANGKEATKVSVSFAEAAAVARSATRGATAGSGGTTPSKCLPKKVPWG